MKSLNLVYLDPNKPYALFTDVSKCAWSTVSTQEHATVINGKFSSHENPITYVSGLFEGSQLNWASLTKGAYAIYMAVKKLSFYLADVAITLFCDHLPLK